MYQKREREEMRGEEVEVDRGERGREEGRISIDLFIHHS